MPDSNGLAVAAVAITAIGSLGGAVYSARQSRAVANRQTKVEETKVESAAYDQAQRINDQAMARLQSEIERISAARKADAAECAQRIEELEAQFAVLRKQLNVEHANSGRLELELAHLDRIVAALRKVVEDAGLPLPPIVTAPSPSDQL